MGLIQKIRSRQAVVCIVGAGYVGLPNAVRFAEKGFRVVAADVNPRIVSLTSQGVSHINDPGLARAVPKAFRTGRLTATTNVTQAAREADVVILSVPTPAKGGRPDLSFVRRAARSVGRGLKRGSLVVLESTVYPSACQRVLRPALERASGLRCGRDFFLAHCPERLNPGDGAHAIANTPRVVGGLDAKSTAAAAALYRAIVDAPVMPLSSMDAAEFVKLVENTQRDINIAYVNEVALLCERMGVDVEELLRGCATKWNFYPARPGPGVGGHCIPNNPYYILQRAREVGMDPRFIRLARKVNEEMPKHVVELVEAALHGAGKGVRGARVALVGVAYKANVDDVRQAPSRDVAALLKARGARVLVTDPHVNEANMAKVAGNPVSLGEALRADCAVFLVPHAAYRTLRPRDVKAKAVVDAAFLFKPAGMARWRTAYRRLGLPAPRD